LNKKAHLLKQLNRYFYAMALSNIMAALTAGKSIVSNLPLADEAHFRFLEQNPAAAAMLTSYAKSSVAAMLKTIPVGREAEYVEMVQRAFKAFQLPENSPELVSFVELYDVGHQPQIKPRNTLVNFAPDNSKSGIASRIVITIMIMLMVVLPTLLFMFENRPGMAIIVFLVLSVLVIRGFIKHFNKVVIGVKTVNTKPGRVIKDLESERALQVSTRTQHVPKSEPGRQGKIAEPVRNIAEESARPGKDQRYTRQDNQRRYRK
jgi:hypothetical protein